MQNVIETKFKKLIAKRNLKSYIKAKVIVRFSSLFLIGLAIGYALFFTGGYLEKNLDALIVLEHFDSIFVGSETVSDYLLTMLMASKNDIRHLMFVFISGFTYFCFFASGAIVFSRGALLGFSSSYLIYVYRLNPDIISNKMLVLFMASNIISAVLLIYLSSISYIFSFDFRAIKRNHSVLRRAPVAYKYAFSFILTLGGLLINNLTYCILSFLI